jgi:N-acetylmuramoyl-L-alanine amidase
MITISPGHWAPGTGASAIIDEVTEARKLTKRVVEILKSNGVTTNYVEDNTSKNKTDNLSYLVRQHNLTNRQLDVSIHFNSSSGTDQRGIGTEVLYYNEKTLASKVSKAISNASGLIDRGAKQRTDLAFLNGTHKPAILIEVCFVNSTVDVALYRRDFEKIALGIAAELMTYVGGSAPSREPEVVDLKFLSVSGRSEIRQLLRKARGHKVIGDTHTDEQIEKYNDIQLLSYFAAVVNRTFMK